MLQQSRCAVLFPSCELFFKVGIQGLAKGNNISTVGAVQLSWWSGKPAGTTNIALAPKTPMIATSLSTTLSNIEPERPRSPDVSHLQEEEIVASGWGSDGDEGDGMGML